MPTFTVAEGRDRDVQSLAVERYLSARGLARDALASWPPTPGSPGADAINALMERTASAQLALARLWAENAAAEIASGEVTPDEVREGVERTLNAHPGVIYAHVAAMWEQADDAIVRELAAWYDRAKPFAEERYATELAAPSETMVSLPPREQIVRVKWRGVPRGYGGGEKPSTHATFLAPDDPRFWQELHEARREATRRAAREAWARADKARPTEIRRSAGGVVSAGPKKRKRRRKPRKK